MSPKKTHQDHCKLVLLLNMIFIVILKYNNIYIIWFKISILIRIYFVLEAKLMYPTFNQNQRQFIVGFDVFLRKNNLLKAY